MRPFKPDWVELVTIVKGIIFAIGGVAIIWYSWPSLRYPRSHGFPRCFAFIAIWGLFLLNVDSWFRNPFSLLQVVSWISLTASLALVVQGFYLLKYVGRPEGNIEMTANLVKTGAYRYIRHPLYTSLLCLAWGIGLKDLSPASTVLMLLATAALFATARFEEVENLRRFGEEYAAYMKVTKMFFPYLF